LKYQLALAAAVCLWAGFLAWAVTGWLHHAGWLARQRPDEVAICVQKYLDEHPLPAGQQLEQKGLDEIERCAREAERLDEVRG
jgi:hypothetical protein